MGDRFDVAEEERASGERAKRFLAGEGGSGEPPVGYLSRSTDQPDASPPDDDLGWTDGGVPTSEDFQLRTRLRLPEPGARHDPEHLAE